MTANKERGEVEIVLDKPRIMVLNFKALAQAETIGKFKVFGLKLNDVGVNEFRALGFAGLQKYNRELTFDQFDELIDSQERFVALQTAVLAAINGSFGGNKEQENKENPQTPA